MSDSTSQQARGESEITLGLLTAVDRDQSVTQRRLAYDLGIALGLANAYIRRCVTKGLIKIAQAPTHRYAYYLTPKGFAEKSRLTAEFLSQSFKLIRMARQQYSEILERCVAQGIKRIAIFGAADLAEVVVLCARDFQITVVGAVSNGAAVGDFGVPLAGSVAELADFDVIIVADLADPQRSYDRLVEALGHDKVLTPAFLNISRSVSRSSDEDATP